MTPGMAKSKWDINKSVATLYLISRCSDDSHVRHVMMLAVAPLIPHPQSRILVLCPEIVSEFHLPKVALNSVDIRTADIGNAYLNAKCGEKIWTVAGT